MKDKFNKFMQGRYGVDQLSLFLTYFSILLIIILSFTGHAKFNWIGLLIVILSYFRVFSKNKEARFKENSIFLETIRKTKIFFVRLKRHTIGTKTHKYFTCKKCKTELRVPKRKGKIKIKCPNCGETYIMRT